MVASSVSTSSASLRTPTIALAVRLALRGESVTSATLFLPDLPRQHRTQLLDDVRQLLEHEREFLPMDLDGERTLVNRAAISYVIVPRRPTGSAHGFSDEEISDVHTLYDYRCPVVVTLMDARTLRGTFLFSSSADRARLGDFLSFGPRFLPLWRERELVLVQRTAIRSIIETAEP